MRRKRFQKGSLQTRKHGRHRVWVAFWWEEGERRCKLLGRFSLMSKSEAEAVLSALLREINSGSARSTRPVYTFEQYTNDVYLPFCRRSWKESTAGTSEQIVKSHLVPEFGKALLSAIRREALQDFLDGKALDLSESVVSHLRWFLNGIFKLALSDGLVLSNPAAELRIPRKCQPGRAMRPLTEKEVAAYLEVFDLREELIVRLAIFEGLRPGEILALRWKALAGDIIRVEERVYKRVFNTPKNGKKREGGISDGTLGQVQRIGQHVYCTGIIRGIQSLVINDVRTDNCAVTQADHVGLVLANPAQNDRETAESRCKKISHDGLTHCMKLMTSKMGSTWITGFGPSVS